MRNTWFKVFLLFVIIISFFIEYNQIILEEKAELVFKFEFCFNLMTSNKVKNAEQQNKHIKNSFRGCTYIDSVLQSTNMHIK